MKKILLFCAAALLCAACGNERNKETGLYGNVKKVTTSEYRAENKFGEVKKGELEGV